MQSATSSAARSTGTRAPIWANKRKDGWSDTEYQIRNWYHFLWLCGDHIVEQHVHNLDVACWAFGAHPIKAVGMGGRQVISEPERGQSYDHFAIDYEFPNGVHVLSMCRQIAGCANNVSETFVGTKGQWHSGGYRFSGSDSNRVRIEHEVNPYVQEHIDLLESIVSHKPVNELKQVAESTLTAIMGRDVGLHRQGSHLGEGAELQARHLPQGRWRGARWRSPRFPARGRTELI